MGFRSQIPFVLTVLMILFCAIVIADREKITSKTGRTGALSSNTNTLPSGTVAGSCRKRINTWISQCLFAPEKNPNFEKSNEDDSLHVGDIASALTSKRQLLDGAKKLFR